MNIDYLTSEIFPPDPVLNEFKQMIWSIKEDQRLFNSYMKFYYKDKEALLRLFPNRTLRALERRAYDLKIPRKCMRYTFNEDELLDYLYVYTNLTYKEMTKFFKFRTAQALKMRMVLIRRR